MHHNNLQYNSVATTALHTLLLTIKIKGKYRFNVDMSKLCWFKTGGTIDALFLPENLLDLQQFLTFISHVNYIIINNHDNNINVDLINNTYPLDINYRDITYYDNLSQSMLIPIFILGVGSNILIKDGKINGIVIRLGKAFCNMHVINLSEHKNSHQVVVGAGCLDYNVANFCLQHGLSGAEFLSGIPGTIGGALAMNAGSYGSDISKILDSVLAINIHGMIKKFTVEEIGYGYRTKNLNNDWIFIEATLNCIEKDKAEILTKMNSIAKNRAETQPIKLKTCGSTFKNIYDLQLNPKQYRTWQLIESAECKHMKIGGAHISDLHANFIINSGTATSNDINDLITQVQQTVLLKHNILLETEIIKLGKFI